MHWKQNYDEIIKLMFKIRENNCVSSDETLCKHFVLIYESNKCQKCLLN